MTIKKDVAEHLLQGDPRTLALIAARPLVIARDNLVARPWGGRKLIDFKHLGEDGGAWSAPVGESFEISADHSDAEARQFPSQVVLADGSRVSLPALLAAGAEVVLGAAFVARHGRRFPLLPKLLNIRELLSVQGHPAGNTEVYVVVAAEPGATLRLGFNQDMDGGAMTRRLEQGRAEQLRLLSMLTPNMDLSVLQGLLAPAFAGRAIQPSALAEQLLSYGQPRAQVHDVASSLALLNDTYWWMLDSMNEIPVVPGQVIHNCNPDRLVARGAEPSAEVHALGNPQAQEILALEIRKPGPTFRAWDNVRFPIREVDVPAAVAALNLRATAAEEFFAVPQPVEDQPGTFVSVASPDFRIEHLRPRVGAAVAVSGPAVHCLHGLGGTAELTADNGGVLGRIDAGESLLIPVGMGSYRLASQDPATEIVKVTLPG